MIRTGLWGTLYSNHIREPPPPTHNIIGTYFRPPHYKVPRRRSIRDCNSLCSKRWGWGFWWGLFGKEAENSVESKPLHPSDRPPSRSCRYFTQINLAPRSAMHTESSAREPGKSTHAARPKC